MVHVRIAMPTYGTFIGADCTSERVIPLVYTLTRTVNQGLNVLQAIITDHDEIQHVTVEVTTDNENEATEALRILKSKTPCGWESTVDKYEIRDGEWRARGIYMRVEEDIVK